MGEEKFAARPDADHHRAGSSRDHLMDILQTFRAPPEAHKAAVLCTATTLWTAALMAA